MECSIFPVVLVMFSLFCPLPCHLHEDMEVDKIMRTLLTLGANSSTPRRHGSGQNNGNITNTRDKCSHYFVHFHVFLECSSWPLVLVLFSLFCALPCLRGVTRALHEDMEVDKIMRPFLILAANLSTPRRHGSGQNNENITNTRGKLELESSSCT
jgi:hypothetical protein